MKLWKSFFLAVLVSVATTAEAAGVREIEIPADPRGPAIQAVMWTPCATAPGDMKPRPFVVSGVQDCPVAGKNMPLIVISHGGGGSVIHHRDTAETLADAGFIVVALFHPRDSAMSMIHFRHILTFAERPTDVRRVVDFMLGPSPAATAIDPERIGFFGFSRGGYTGLVLAGGNPDLLIAPCAQLGPPAAFCAEPSRSVVPKHPLDHDPRIKAFVIADPVAPFFPDKESVKTVTAPIQLWSSEKGGDGVTPEDVAAVAGRLPVRPEFHLVPKSTHLSFMAPCPPQLAKREPQGRGDMPGFDRVAFHKDLNAQVLAFFRRTLR